MLEELREEKTHKPRMKRRKNKELETKSSEILKRPGRSERFLWKLCPGSRNLPPGKRGSSAPLVFVRTVKRCIKKSWMGSSAS